MRLQRSNVSFGINLLGLVSRIPRKNVGFTLVELIVVITILAILGTIGFIQLGGFQSNTRDSIRTFDLANLSKGLDVFQIKSGRYPVPTGTLSYTGWVSGWTILQQWGVNGGIIGYSVATPLDPLTKTEYVYSVLGNGQHYQLGAEAENTLARAVSPLVEEAYASGPKTALVKGNYTSDPSLPSLIVIPSSVPGSGSGGIFSPNVAFVTNGSTTNLVSVSTGYTLKKDISLKTLDSSLVGYWDMETTTLSGGVTLLKDLSGNGNDGVFSGTVLPTSTWASLGKGYYFSGSSIINTIKSVPYVSGKNISVEIITKTQDTRLSQVGQILIESGPNTNSNTGSYFITDFDRSNATYFTDFRTNAATRDLSYKWGVNYYIQRSSATSAIDKYKIITAVFDKNWQWSSVRLFINGIEQIQDDTIPDTLWQTLKYKNADIFLDYPLFIWNRLGSNIGTVGIIDDVKIYNRALSDSEIRQHAKAAGF